MQQVFPPYTDRARFCMPHALIAHNIIMSRKALNNNNLGQMIISKTENKKKTQQITTIR